MTILLVQTFLLMLGAFLLGASLACLMRRAFSGGRAAATAGAADGLAGVAVSNAAPRASDTDRFGRALAGDSLPPVFQAGQPVVEVQSRPAPSPQPAAPEPEPEPEVVSEVVPSPEPAATATRSPEPDPAPEPIAPAAPVAEAAPSPSQAPSPQPEPAVEQESYTQIAVAAAAAALAARAKAEAEAAEAAKAAEAAALAAEDAAADEDDAAAASHFGTPALKDEDLPPPVSWEPTDDLTRIRGINAETKERLHRYGVHQFAAIAAWTQDDVRGVSQSLGIQGRIERENWIEQAQILAQGGFTDYARKHDAAATQIEAAAPVDGDRLHRIIGIDPTSEASLRANGVTQLVHIAAWTAADVEEFEALLDTQGRITNEGWVEQARFLTRHLRAEDDAREETEAAIEEAPVEAVAEDPQASIEEAPSETVAEDAPVAVGGAAPETFETPVAPEATPAAAEVPEPPSASVSSGSQSYAGLRSVRSEALRGEGLGALSSGAVDDLKRIRGIGVLIEKKLNSLGITSYEQVANWTGADIDRISQILDFKGRIERENWIEQARILASGGQTEFSRRADRGEI